MLPTLGTGLLSDGNTVVIRLLIGNTILAIVAAFVSYILVYRLLKTYEKRRFPVVEETVEEFVEELEVVAPDHLTADRPGSEGE